MTPKSLAAIPAILLALASSPTLALDLSVGGSVQATTSAGGGDASAGASVGASVSGSASAGAGGDAKSGGQGFNVAAASSSAASASAEASAYVPSSDVVVEVIALINASDWTNLTFDALQRVRGSTYDVAAEISAQGRTELEAALSANREKVAQLQGAISASATMNAWLETENASASSVIAVGVAADGSLAVFTY